MCVVLVSEWACECVRARAAWKPHTAITPPAPQVSIWRDGRHVDLSVELRVPESLVPAHSHDVKPDYYMYAGAHGRRQRASASWLHPHISVGRHHFSCC